MKVIRMIAWISIWIFSVIEKPQSIDITPEVSVQSFCFLRSRESYFKTRGNFQETFKKKKKRWRFEFSVCSVIGAAETCSSNKTWFLTVPFTLWLKPFAFLQVHHLLFSSNWNKVSLRTSSIFTSWWTGLRFNSLMAILADLYSLRESLA